MAITPAVIKTQITKPGTVVFVIPDPHNPTQEIEQIFALVPSGFGPGASGREKDVDVDNIGAFPPKQVIGEWKDTSHQVLSSAGQNSWAGGGQLRDAIEADGIDRAYGIPRMDTRFPRQLMHLGLTVSVEGPNTTGARPVGDLLAAGGTRRCFVAYGSTMRELTGTFPAISLTGTTYALTDPPSAKGVMFFQGANAKMYIPQGDQGYQTFNGTTVDAQITTVKPLNFVAYSKKLWCVDVDGKLWKSLDGTNWLEVIQLDPGHIVRGLIPHLDRSEQPALYIVTDDMVFAVDEGVPAAYETDINYAPHPHSGLAFERWRTDLYVAHGLGILRDTLGTVNAVGLDRDNGPGPEFAGYISAMSRGFNDLFAGLTPILQPGGEVEESVVDQGPEVYVGGIKPRAAVMRLTGAQSWHTVWIAPERGGDVTDLHVSAALTDYFLCWGWDGRIWVHQLSVGFDNPAENPNAHFMPDGELISSWFDMGMRADRMTLAAIEAHAGPKTTESEHIELSYQIDDDDETNTWHVAGDLTVPHHHEFRLGANGEFPTNQTPKTRYDGVGFRRVRYRVRSYSDPTDTHKTAVLESVTMPFIKRMRRLRNFSFTIDCSNPDLQAEYGLGNDERRAAIVRMIDSETFIPMLYRRTWIMVKMAYANGSEGTSTDSTGNLSVSTLEAWELPAGA